jgi:hypothetical protein
MEIAARSVETAARSVETAARSVEIASYIAAMAAYTVEMAVYSIRIAARSTEIAARSIRIATYSIRIAAHSVETAHYTAETPGNRGVSILLANPIISRHRKLEAYATRPSTGGETNCGSASQSRPGSDVQISILPVKTRSKKTILSRQN